MKRVKQDYETKYKDHKKQTESLNTNQQNEIEELNRIIQ